MEYYQRYASGEHDRQFFEEKRSKENKIKDEKLDLFNIPPLLGQFGDRSLNEERYLDIEEWRRIFADGAVFTAYDEVLFGHIIILVHEDLYTKKISTKSLTRFGYTCYKNLILDERSRFWPSCENLRVEYKNSNVRRALAITNLKNYNTISNNPGNLKITKHWDETNAGELANSMNIIPNISPSEIGDNLLRMGLFQCNYTRSVLVDVIYQNPTSEIQKNILADNDKIVFQLGDQLENLFDPLLEYCPQEMETFYIPPDKIFYTKPLLFDSDTINNILNELVEVQKNIMTGLVGLLQDFIIPLRIHVLKLGSTAGISKINQVFPPTIDEIARINCILHGFLEKASEFGYLEVFKVMGMMMPYFYKAFIRHEANLKGFNQRLGKFFARNKKKVLTSKIINKTSYTAKEIDSIVSGSLFELPRFKLILQRLYKAIEGEKAKLRNFEQVEDTEDEIIDKNIKIAIDVIEAFGGDSNDKDKNIDVSQRIFTPTGKILTEVASKWPPELQYGWLNRKVVGIFELHNILSPNPNIRSEVLIIFSDHLMFLSVHKSDESDKTRIHDMNSLSISDILMHSLVNEKPLPNLSQLPYIEVNSWCDIHEVFVTCYRAPDNSSNEKEFLRFMCTLESGFKVTPGSPPISIKQYEIIDNTNNYSESGKLIELINKSRILRKNQPFHLFKSVDEGLQIYSTAQTVSNYENEISKSPIALFLNFSLENPESYFNTYPNLLSIILITVLNDHQFEIEVYDKLKESKIKEVVLYNNLISFLEEIISTAFSSITTTTNTISDKIRESYEFNMAGYLESILPKKVPSEVSKEIVKPQINNKRNGNIKTSPTKNKPAVQINRNNNNTGPTIKKKKDTSFFKKILRAFRKPSELVVVDDIESIKTTNYSNKGEEREFKHLYSPAPKLLKQTESKLIKGINDRYGKEESFNDTENPAQRDNENHIKLNNFNESNAHQAKSIENEETSEKEKEVELSGVNNSSSNYNNTTQSIDANPQFTFPAKSEGSIEEETTRTVSNKNGLVHRGSDLIPREVSAEDLSKIKEVHGDENISVHSYNISSLSYELFYRDGESNWVSLTKDNSFLLHEEVQALKEDANMDTEDVIIVNENDSVHMKSLFNHLDASASLEKFFTPYSDPIEQFFNNIGISSDYSQAPKGINPDPSLQSLTSSQMINEFSNAINFDTSMDEGLNDLSAYTNDIGMSNYAKAKSGSYITVNTNSSEDEFFSPDEYEGYEAYSNYNQRVPSSNSFSSEATIINEKLADTLPLSKQDSNQILGEGNSNRNSLTREIIYLSDIIDNCNI